MLWKKQESGSTMDSYSKGHLAEAINVLQLVETEIIEALALRLQRLKAQGGRLFVIGVGGSAANASHAVNDFRKLAGIETYSPADNVSELTARTNDEGWETVFSSWLQVSNFSSMDLLFVLSVGGGDLERGVSTNIVRAVELAKEVGADVAGIVGRDGGFTAQNGDYVVLVPTVSQINITPHSESTQSVILHLLVSHPFVKINATKW